MKTIVLTGGHMSPALAMVEEMIRKGWNVVLLGRSYSFSEAKDKRSLESIAARELAIPFINISAPRLPDTLLKFPLYFVFIIITVVTVMKHLIKLRPTAVLAFGGYIAVPVIIASYLLRIPMYLHDQTTKAGRASRLFSLFAVKIFVSWKESYKEYPFFVRNKIILSGNPIRKELRNGAVNKHIHRGLSKNVRLYVTGGSTGSHAINMLIERNLRTLLTSYMVYHQCGDSQFNDYASLKLARDTLPKELRERYVVEKFILPEKLSSILSQTDIVIGRSGANTVVEVLIFEKPAIFIPLPYSQYNEQDHLARIVEKAGSALIIRQEECSRESLLSAIQKVVRNYQIFIDYARTIRQSEEVTIHTTAHRNIADCIERCSN